MVAVLLSGGLFGFFFTMPFSIMPGLDQTPAYSALIANQMIGRATKASYLAILIFGTPAMLIAGIILSGSKPTRIVMYWQIAALVSWIGMVVIDAIAKVFNYMPKCVSTLFFSNLSF